MSDGRVCSRCGTVTEGNFCSNCGARLNPEGVLPQPSQPKAGIFTRRMITFASLGFILVVLIGTIFYLTREFNNIELLPAIITSVWENGITGRLDPVSVPVSGTPAVDVNPIPGVRIHAPANVLERPRLFTVKN